ncbi:SET domain-containing protein SmydA-8-like [Agrilus planipennis]|uniref:SET domain-containing protein SmydA-8-like n=1 Tax=Agrilus planipennis TaxID=224129 RepID=A0A1W4WG27_AGRPL|nr:SET domain-containing protein SmydA-8-like [Agrilus planipennis]
MSEFSKCAVCQKSAEQKCGGCFSVFYCSKEHQITDWKTHRKDCFPFKICEDPHLGRYLKATKPIKKGEKVLQELPLVWGPLQHTKPVCLGCGKGLNSQTCRPCEKCGWPVCSERCEKSSNHIPECSFTTAVGKRITIDVFDAPHPSYQCITPLRCLYIKQNMPDIWEKLDRLKSHCEERKKTEKYEQDKYFVANFLRSFFQLEEVCTDEEILRFCGIVTVNGHEVPLKKPPFVAVYEKTSMFEHSCKANCCKTFTAKGEVLITAGVPIEKGDHLTICYTDPLWGTPNRRYHLSESKFFWCVCPRCSDPTEFGTYLSCLRCKLKECDGILIPETFISENVTTPIIWTCNACNMQIDDEEAQNIVEHVGRDLQAMDKDSTSASKKFLEYYSNILPTNHFYLTDVRLALIEIIGMELEEGLSGVSDDDLHLKLQLCKQLSSLVQILAPAENRLMGTILFEQHAAIAEIGRRRTNFGEEGQGDFYSTLQEAKRILTEAATLLKNEPEEIREGKLYKQAKFALDNMEIILANFVRANKETLI